MCDHIYEIKNVRLDMQLGSHCLHFSNFRFEYQILWLLWCCLEVKRVSWGRGRGGWGGTMDQTQRKYPLKCNWKKPQRQMLCFWNQKTGAITVEAKCWDSSPMFTYIMFLVCGSSEHPMSCKCFCSICLMKVRHRQRGSREEWLQQVLIFAPFFLLEAEHGDHTNHWVPLC